MADASNPAAHRLAEAPTRCGPAQAVAAKPDVSLCIPVYRDERTLVQVVDRAVQLLDAIAGRYEIIIVDDASPDRAGQLADELARANPKVRVAHHDRNLGYGAAFKTGKSQCVYEWICMVDGDNEYDVFDLKRMLALRGYYPVIIGFRYKKLYSTWRTFVSYVYNVLLRFLFRSPFRDISTGIRVVHRSVLDEIRITSDSSFAGAELAIKAMLHGFPVGEVGIQTFPRSFGTGSAASV
jgi:glycosyltransferase involved in cell wall biosynthesis